MATQSGASEIDAARKRLAVAKKWEESAEQQAKDATKNLAAARGEREQAEADLKAAEKKWEVISVDDEEEENSSPPSKKQKQSSGPELNAAPTAGQAGRSRQIMRSSGGNAAAPTAPRQRQRRTRSNARRQLLQYPFNPGRSSPELVYATMGMKELNGHLLGVDGAVSNQSTACAGVYHTLSPGESQVTICGSDRELLQTNGFLSVPLVDFWTRWISRGELQNGSNSKVHFFPTSFMSTLVHQGPGAVGRLTSVMNPFDKKLLFFPVHADFHWSLLVVVNPGLVTNNFDDDGPENEDHAFILFFDSLKKHSKKTYSKHIRKWLNCEWKRLKKTSVGGSRIPFNETVKRVPIRSPKIPYQENATDSGVFVCRYAYALYVMRHKKFTWLDALEKPAFTSLITNGPAFDFGMSDAARIRSEFALLIDRLSATGNI